MALKPEANGMEYDQDKVDEMTLALLWLTSFKDPGRVRAWKGQYRDTMERHLRSSVEREGLQCDGLICYPLSVDGQTHRRCRAGD